MKTFLILLTLICASPAFAQATTSAPAEVPETIAEVVEPVEAVEPADVRIDLNTASAAELESLPGIGPAKARAIIDYRERRRFRRSADIIRVRGIGRATFRRLRDSIRVDAR